MKLFATVMYSIAALVILVLALECTGIIPISIGELWWEKTTARANKTDFTSASWVSQL